MKTKTQLHLGASMYVPTTQDVSRLVDIANGARYSQLKSVIFCTEDAVRPEELNGALRNLKHALPQFNHNDVPMRFIRVRNPGVLGSVMRMAGIERIDGFVLPKITRANIGDYLSMFSDGDTFRLMPTLETREVFDAYEMTKLRQMLAADSRVMSRILCLRIGGNDLLNCIRVRRDPRHTIYATAVGDVIKRLAGEFIPHGIGLTAPVCEVTDPQYNDVLDEEIELDLLQGLFGKTAIHPDQIERIEAHFKVNPEDYEEAIKIVDPNAPAVFKPGSRMCEPTTHTYWAQDIIARAEAYGVKGR